MNIKNRICLVREDCLQQESPGCGQTGSHSSVTVTECSVTKEVGMLTPIDLPS